MLKLLDGVYTALITPFTMNDDLDEKGLRLLIARQIKSNVNGIVVLGTTGESPTLTKDEKIRITKIAKEECNGKMLLIVGTGNYSTKETIENTLLAENEGADAALIITPYYNKPSAEGLYLHFKKIAELTSLPIILYNNPSRCTVNLQPETVRQLMQSPSIIGIKEASGNISQIKELINIAKNERPEFRVFSGDDSLTLSAMNLGANGVISVISNLLPEKIVELVTSIIIGDFERAHSLNDDLISIVKLATIETNPIPIKEMHQLMELPGGKCRLPLTPLNWTNKLAMKAYIDNYITNSHNKNISINTFNE